MKLAIIYNKKKFSGKLTKLFTGCHAYHIGWVDEKNDKFYDMHWIRRRRIWSEYKSKENTEFTLHEFKKVTREYLERKLETDKAVYGVLDYVLFALRPIYHFFGKSTVNAGGVICSEMVNNDILANGYITPFNTEDGPPSPCDFARWLNTKGN